MNYNEISSLIEGTEGVVKKCSEVVQAYVVDRNQPLDERWKIFVKSPAYLFKRKTFVMHLETFEKLGFRIGYDEDIYVERYESVDLGDRMHTFLLERKDDRLTPEAIASIKEEILEKGIRIFQYDW